MTTFREITVGSGDRLIVPENWSQPDQDQVRQIVSVLWEAYQEGPYSLPPDQLIGQLKEVDPGYLEDALNDILYERVGAGYTSNLEKERGRAIDESRRLYRVDVITQKIIAIWTDFGFGQSIQVTPVDERALDPWNRFWNSDENAAILAPDRIYEMSEDLLTDGERYLAYFISTVDGETGLREIDTKEIAEQFITDPDDKSTVLYYKRNYSDAQGPKEMYYLDYLAAINGWHEREVQDKQGNLVPVWETVLPKGAARAEAATDATYVVMQHIPYNRKGGAHGWPLMAASAPWVRAHKKFREDRASVAAAIAMFVAQIKAKGGSRAVDAIRAKLASTLSASNTIDRNPAAPAGSTLIGNEGVDYTKLPLSTGAGDAQTDGNALLQMAGLGGGLYLHWLGAGEAFRLATATAMEQPILRQFTRYQNFWAAQFKKMTRIVLWADERWGSGVKYKSYDANVSTDKILKEDFTALITAIGQLFSQVYFPAVLGGQLPDAPARKIMTETWRMVLTTLGVSKVDEIVNDQTMAPEAAAPPVPPVAPAASMAAEVRELTSTLKEAMAMVGKNGKH